MRNRVAAPTLRLRTAMPTLIMAALCLYFSFYLLFGPRGYLALQRIQDTFHVADSEHAELVDKRKSLQADVKLMRPDSLDADMADEQARRSLGYTKPGEIIIHLN